MYGGVVHIRTIGIESETYSITLHDLKIQATVLDLPKMNVKS